MQEQTALFVFYFLVHSKYAVISHYYYAPLEERIILISVSACLFVCVFVCLFLLLQAYLPNYTSDLCQISCACQWLGPPLAALLRHGKAKVASPYSITERRVPELIPVLGSQPAGDVSHNRGGRLSLLSARPAVTPATLKRAATDFSA